MNNMLMNYAIRQPTALPSDLAMIEIALCCDAIVAAYNARIDRAIAKTEARVERLLKRAGSKEDAEKREVRIREIKAEGVRHTRELANAREAATSCLEDDARGSIVRCIDHFSRIVELGRDQSPADIEIFLAAGHMLPLVSKLKSLLHIALSYPQDAMNRARKLAGLAATADQEHA